MIVTPTGGGWGQGGPPEARRMTGQPRSVLLQLLPIKMPAASTRPPPSMTLAAAANGGVFMNCHWITRDRDQFDHDDDAGDDSRRVEIGNEIGQRMADAAGERHQAADKRRATAARRAPTACRRRPEPRRNPSICRRRSRPPCRRGTRSRDYAWRKRRRTPAPGSTPSRPSVRPVRAE